MTNRKRAKPRAQMTDAQMTDAARKESQRIIMDHAPRFSAKVRSYMTVHRMFCKNISKGCKGECLIKEKS